jgi:threonyl-tRNA synthetase
MLVIGDREVEGEAVAVRLRNEKNLGAMSIPDFITMVQEAVAEKRDL